MLSNPKSPPSLGRRSATSTVDTQKIANRVGVFRAVEPVQDVASRVVLLRCGAIEARDQRGSESFSSAAPGVGEILRRHGAHTNLAHHFFPDFRVGARIFEIRLIQSERRAGRDFRLSRCGR